MSSPSRSRVDSPPASRREASRNHVSPPDRRPPPHRATNRRRKQQDDARGRVPPPGVSHSSSPWWRAGFAGEGARCGFLRSATGNSRPGATPHSPRREHPIAPPPVQLPGEDRPANDRSVARREDFVGSGQSRAGLPGHDPEKDVPPHSAVRPPASDWAREEASPGEEHARLFRRRYAAVLDW